jgi:hypothetical protein
MGIRGRARIEDGVSTRDNSTIGSIVGLGLTGAFTVGTIAAIIHARKKEQDYVDRCHAYYNGEVPGYSTEPGQEYLVLVQDGAEFLQLCDADSIWFTSSGEEARFIYDLAKRAGELPPLGALIVLAHHRKTGSHYIGKKGPMRGFNLWGQFAGKGWTGEGRPIFLDWDREASFRNGDVVASGRTWKFFDAPEESIRDWLYSTLNNWPKARQELKKKSPDPYAYAWYLQDAHSMHGGSYTSIMNQPGGVWTWASSVVKKMQDAAQALHEEHAYNGLVDWAESWPLLDAAQAMELEARYPDHSIDYPSEDLR